MTTDLTSHAKTTSPTPSGFATGRSSGLTGQGDIPLLPLGKLAWDAANVESSLAALFSQSTDTAQSAIKWYLKAKRPSQIMARVVRGLSILLVTLAGIIPMLSQGFNRIQPIWASVALGLAAAAIVLDRFYGLSSGWMRYITTELHLRQMLHDFQLDWEAGRATWKGAPPTHEQVQRAIAVCRAFVSQVDGLVRDETNLWVAEFQESLKQLDDSVKAKAAAAEPAAVSLVVTNGDLSTNGWTVSFDNGPAQSGNGKTAALAGLRPGIHTLKVAGTLNGKQVVAEKAISTPAGAVTTVEVAL